MNRRSRAAVTAVLAIGLLAGCPKAVHPGAANQFDSSTYDGLIVTHSVIETTKTDLANNSFPAAIAGNVKTALNKLITAYDTLDTFYQAYHAAALAGTATAAQQASVTSAQADVNSATAALTAAKAAK